MRRLLAAVVAVAVCATACFGGDDAKHDSAGKDVSGAIRVQVSGGASEIAAYKGLAAAFQKSHPRTKVNVAAVADEGDHVARLATALAGSNPPDVFVVDHRRYAPFAERGVIEPMGEHLGPLDDDDFAEQAIDAFTYKGKLQCLPQSASSAVVYLNTALFAAAGVAAPKQGWTVADLASTVDRLAAKGVKDPIGFAPSLRTLAPFVWSAGGEIVDDNADPTRIALGSAPARGALELLISLERKGAAATDRAAGAAGGAETRFARGQVAMLIDSRRAVPALRKAKVPFDVVPLPVEREAATLFVSDGYCVAKAAKNQSLAQEFARYAVGSVGGKVLAASGLTVPSLTSLASSPAFLDPARAPKSAKVWLDALPTARRLPDSAAWHAAEEVADGILAQVFAGKLPVDQAIERISADTAREFAERR
jgi:multiple sugar transport system substrate-binding protein